MSIFVVFTISLTCLASAAAQHGACQRPAQAQQSNCNAIRFVFTGGNVSGIISPTGDIDGATEQFDAAFTIAAALLAAAAVIILALARASIGETSRVRK
jgi:hypothetical protein